jgi:hypothetical protein
MSYSDNFGFYWDPFDLTVRGLNNLDWDGELEGHSGSKFILYTRQLIKIELNPIKKTSALNIVVQQGGRFYIVGQEEHIEVKEVVEIVDYASSKAGSEKEEENTGRIEWIYQGTATSAKKSIGLCGNFEVNVAFEA